MTNAIDINDPLFPVSGFTTGPLTAHDGVLIRLDFLEHPQQDLALAQPGRVHTLSRAQAEGLVRSLHDTLLKLHTAGSPPAPGQQH